MQLRLITATISSVPSLIVSRFSREVSAFLIGVFTSGLFGVWYVYQHMHHGTPINLIGSSEVVLAEPSPKVTQPPTSSSTPIPTVTQQIQGKVNINTASISELDALPGIGPVYAQRIVDARPFARVSNIQRVAGIGPKTYQKLKDLITTE